MTRPVRLALASCIIIGLAALSACGGEEKSADRGTRQTTGSTTVKVEGAPESDDRFLDARYHAALTGDLDITVDEQIELRVLRVTADDEQFEALRLLSVGPAEPFRLPDGSALRVAFDLSRYDEDGDYTIQAGSPRDRAQRAGEADAPASGTDMSNVLIQHWPSGDVTLQPDIFDNAIEACSLAVRDEGFEGTLSCPRVKNDADGRAVTVEMSWGG